MKQSSFFSLNVKDLLKSAFLAAIAIIVPSVISALSTMPPHLPTWPEFLATLKLAGATAGLYLLKNLFTNSKDEMLQKEPKKSNFPNISRI